MKNRIIKIKLNDYLIARLVLLAPIFGIAFMIGGPFMISSNLQAGVFGSTAEAIIVCIVVEIVSIFMIVFGMMQYRSLDKSLIIDGKKKRIYIRKNFDKKDPILYKKLSQVKAVETISYIEYIEHEDIHHITFATPKNAMFTFFSVIRFNDGDCYVLRESTKKSADKKTKKVKGILSEVLDDNKLNQAEEYVEDNKSRDLNEELAESLNIIFNNCSKYLLFTKEFTLDYWEEYTNGEYTNLLCWKMFLNADLPFKKEEVIEIVFGDGEMNQYEKEDEEYGFYFKEGVMIYDEEVMDTRFEEIIITYELFINYAALIRNEYEKQLKTSSMNLEDIKNKMNEIDKLIKEYCIKYDVEVASDFSKLSNNLSEHILRIITPGDIFVDLEIPSNIEVF